MSVRNRIRVFIVWLIVIFSIVGKAQDIHFSQFYHSPLFINPANTGVFIGNYRLSTNYKNQWKSVTNPYKTEFAGIEISLPKKGIGLGLSFFNDIAGKSKMRTTQGNLSASYTLRINDDNAISTGMQFGFVQQSIKIADLKWDSQFVNGFYDPANPSGETQMSLSSSYMDLSAGMIWHYLPKHSKFKTTGGLAFFHVNQPVRSFYDNGKEKLYNKIIVHVNNQIPTGNSKLFILPQVMFASQGPHKELSAGALVKYLLNGESNDLVVTSTINRKYSSSAVFAGAQMRYKDALTFMSAFEFKKGLLISMSYDLNISKLHVASKFKGGLELALLYRGYF